MRFCFGMQCIVVAVCFSALSVYCFGQGPYPLNDLAAIHRLDSHIEVLVDTTSALSLEQILKPEVQQRFRRSNSNLTFGYLKSTLWIKVLTHTAFPDREWYLEIPAPFLEYVDFYQWRSNQQDWEHLMTGYYRPQNARKISHTSQVIPLEFSTDSLSTVYIKVAGLSPKTFPLNALEKDKFYAKTRLEDILYGVFFGILVVMFFYNLFIYLTLRHGNYLLYIGTIVCTFLIFAAATGYAGKFLWPEHPQLNFYAGRLSLGVHVIFLAVFTIRFLEVRRYSKIMYYILLSLIPLAVLSIILVSTKTLSSAGNTMISITTVTLMISGIVCTIKGNKIGYYFIAAWTIYLLGGLLLTLRNSGVFDFNFWTTHLVEIGAGLETIIIAFALGDRYRRLRKEKEEAQLLALQIQQDATEKLEIKVKERTEELSRANKELQHTLETNERQTKIIEDKNDELDAFFYRISHDLKGPISSLLGLSVLAKREIADQQAQWYIEKQSQQVERLDTIITGLIKLTKLNGLDLQKEKIDFRKLVDECIESFHTAPNFADLVFKKDIQEGIEFHSEWTLLNAILQNLIENAIKYSRHDNAYVHVIIRQESEWIVIEVKDNGQGIPEEHQSRIFGMFYRATHRVNGTGLGLYILKRSVDRLRGTIEIKSTVNVGSTFKVKLPCKPTPQEFSYTTN